jgi:ATP-dependent RNA helicase RhlE
VSPLQPGHTPPQPHPSRPLRPTAGEADAPTPASFAALGLASALVRAAADQGFRWPTPIQSATIPPALKGQDVLGLASTGSGKTGAYGLALLHRVIQLRLPGQRFTHALVIVPTRELALQVAETLQSLSRGLRSPIRVVAVFGGVSVNPQMLSLRGAADVLVATPGRLLDLAQRNAVKLGQVQLLVLDEADRLLDEGFADELAQVKSLLPQQRQTMFFSATFPAAVDTLAATWLHHPLRIDLADSGGSLGSAPEAPAASDGPASAAEDAAAFVAGAPRIDQRAIVVDTDRRTALLRHLVRQEAWSRVLVFVATRHGCEHVAEKLRRAGLSATAFHGDLSQGARTDALAAFAAGAVQVLLATDMAARGLHIPGLPAVVNYDLPRSATDYTHRIGRTARAGSQGVAISFVSSSTESHFRLIEKRQGKRVPREHCQGFEPRPAVAEVATETVEAAGTPASPAGAGGIKGMRKSRKDKLREEAARRDARR